MKVFKVLYLRKYNLSLPRTTIPRSSERGSLNVREAKSPNAPTRFVKAPARRAVRSWVRGLLFRIIGEMRKIKRIPVTREGYEKLVKDLASLKASRPEAVNTLSEARKMGDLSENGLYSAAKMRLRGIDSQILRLNIQIKLADIIEENKSGFVSINSKVLISDGKKERVLHIVGQFEADPLNNKISSSSPIGRGLIGKKTGDRVGVNIPSGRITFEILKVF